MNNKILNFKYIALLFFGSAIFLYGCGDNIPSTNLTGELTPTVSTDSLEMIYSENGVLSYRFITARMDRYETVDSSYMVFTKGVFVETYNDSTKAVTSTLTAKDAIYNETKKFWTVTGDVVSINVEDGRTLYTEELFWDEKRSEIYSVVKSRVVHGEEILIGKRGFTANDDLSDIVFYGTVGRIFLDTIKNVTPRDTDSLAIDSVNKLEPVAEKPLE